MRSIGFLAGTLAALAISSAMGADDAALLGQAQQIFRVLPKDLGTADFPVTKERVRLGQLLFFDPRMTLDGNVSCATCHQPGLYGTDGLPTAHFEGTWLYMLYPPDPRTEAATMREGMLCAREGITINIFLVPSWSQSEEDIRFAYRLAEGTKGRVFFTAGKDLDRYVVWDYVKRKREIVA